jgi:peptidoglycan hydrolase-like protein with peptidoglycan-binding domain
MSNKQLIYKLLRNAGITEAGALGILGNWQAESGCEPNRLQNDFSSFRTASKDYTARVMSGAISRDQFARDQKGYGLAQWTYFNFQTGQGRKLALYDFWKKSGKALDDVTMQVAFALHELTTEGQYATLLQILKTTDDLWTATDKMCRIYEQPYYCNVDARYKYAKEIESQIDLSGTAVVDDNATTEEKPEEPKLETWPPRVIDEHCSGWAEVWLLQSLLKCRGYNVLVDGIFGDALVNKVKQFQREHQLDADGAVGPMSWAKLMERT